MSNYGVIHPIDLDNIEKDALENFMAKAFGTLSVAATERTGFANVLRLRDDFKKGRCNLRRSPDARGVMEQLIKIEERIIGGYIRVGHALFMAFDTDSVQKRPGTTFLDYVQEGVIAIYDAIYTFSGQNQFSTYVYSCIKNRLISFIRNEEGRIGSAKALHFTHHMSNLENETLADKTKPLDPDTEMMADMVRVVSLEHLERVLIEGKLKHGRQFTALFQQSPEGINPDTGKPFTRAWLSQVYLSACRKLQVAYNGDEEEREAA